MEASLRARAPLLMRDSEKVYVMYVPPFLGLSADDPHAHPPPARVQHRREPKAPHRRPDPPRDEGPRPLVGQAKPARRPRALRQDDGGGRAAGDTALHLLQRVHLATHGHRRRVQAPQGHTFLIFSQLTP